MSYGSWLDHMDKNYHHRDHRLGGWIFCDLLDHYYGMSWWSLLKEHWNHRPDSNGRTAGLQPGT